jgi:endonuclease YncB( thermonuclease family)
VLIFSKVALAVAVLALMLATLRIATSDIRMGRARAIGSDVLVVDDLVIHLHGIDTIARGTSCRRAGARWACGDTTAAALAALIDGRWLFCRLLDDGPLIIGTCHAGLDDIARTLVRQGWAVADGNRYAAEQREAMLAGRGLWLRVASTSDSRAITATDPQQP